MNEIGKPDLNAPRFRELYKEVFDKAYIARFKTKHKKQYTDILNYSNADFKNIIKVFNKSLYELVIETPQGVEMPQNLGYIYIGSVKMPMKAINYVESFKQHKIVNHTNLRTDNLMADVVFERDDFKYNFKNSELWEFNTARDFRRTVAKTYPDKWQTYNMVDKKLQIRLRSKRNYNKELSSELTKKQLETYNEFEL